MEDNFKVPNLDILKKPAQKSEKPIQKAEESEIPEAQDDSKEKPVAQPAPQPVIPSPYRVPKWSQKPDTTDEYSFEILKNGTIIENIKNLDSKPYWIFGRLPTSDIVSQHPTTSRFHCVLQWRPKLEDEVSDEEDKTDKPEKGWYLFDLDSTHGTFLNKNRIRPNIYVRVHVGHMIKLGNSTRSYIFCGPDEDTEEESPLTVTEIKEERMRREKEKSEKELQEKLEKERLEKEKEAQGVDWGMGEDAEEESDLSVNPFATTANEELFLDDPKKTLRGFFEREGYDLDYKCEEMSPGTFVCRVELPLDDEYGKPYVAEVVYKGKKKECVVQCALEACRILDRNGVLRQATHEPRKRKQNTYSDDDDDDFLDRTGDVEKKRQKKSATPAAALTYEELLDQEKKLLEKMKDLDGKIEEYREQEKREKEAAEDDDLDSFMTHLSSEKKMDKAEVRKLKIEIQEMRNEHLRIKKMINIARPTNLPPIKKNFAELAQKSKLPLFGKRNFLDKKFGVKKVETTKPSSSFKEFEVEFDEDEEKAGSSKMEKPRNVVLGPKFDPKLVQEFSGVLKDGEKINQEGNIEKISEMKEKLDEIPEESEKLGEISEKLGETSKKPRKPEESLNLEEIPEKSEDSEEIPRKIESQTSRGDEENPEDSELAKKKKRSRLRNREKHSNRSNVDFDEEIFDEEKVSKWVPPSGQSGDGMTALNEKFGY